MKKKKITLKNKDIKIGSPNEALWTKFKEVRENTLKSLEESLIIERALLKLAEEKIKEESR